MVVPTFLEQSLKAFSMEQDRIREQITTAIGKSPMGMMGLDAPMKAMEETVRRNTELFQNALKMFTPFPAMGAKPASEPVNSEDDGLSELKEQIAAMQRKIETLGKK
jgi:polyhydroxyalkanoate synthesis regulator protein